ncbi:glycosyltransferase [Niallia circulans]|uniref:glycosyltransferase family 4 protein n=1 Tax=Shouchella clausii TaxID=79880 RepID=UPI000BA78404|nr:glycosyltransferase family 4 protein [Shouchella clausii]PAF13000.1 glycosyltransferase [Shouchella clausii]SPU21710.1 glycosyltransferase [Niallia circulans]
MIKLEMLSSAEKVKGQGVASAYRELVNVLERKAQHKYDLQLNTFQAADITHYHTIDLKFYLASFSRKRGINVGYVHFLPETVDDSLQLPRFFRRVFYKYILAFYKRMDRLVVVNPSFIDKLAQYGIKRERVSYIPNFVSKEGFSEGTEEERIAFRQRFNIPEQAFVVLGAGQIQHRKGVLDFLDVAKRLKHIHFVWAGGFSFGQLTAGYAELKKLVENPPENVHFTGILERHEMKHCYNAADLLFSPSYHELFPMTILEAMSCNKPLLLRDLPLYENILFDFYERAGTNEAFATTIARLEADRSFYEQTVERAKKGASFYSEDRLLNEWDAFYSSLLKVREPVHE